MSLQAFLLTTWTWHPGVLLAGGAASAAFWLLARRNPRAAHPGAFAAALALVIFALCSPMNTLAEGELFSAHMAQHLLLLVIAPALGLLSLPPCVRGPAWARRGAWPLAGWMAGVGAMWLWHVPALCDAAAASAAVHGAQTLSLLAMGLLFWWPIFAPHPADRVSPWSGIGYLFAACLACSALGILITLTPVEVCPIFHAPLDRFGLLPTIRGTWGISAARDRAAGGLLMWVPMCAIYLGAIVAEIARWYGSGSAAEGEPCR